METPLQRYIREFNAFCDKVMNEETFEAEENAMVYAITRNIESAGKGHVCKYCKYYTAQKCPFTMTQRVNKRMCYNAWKVKTLKENDLYGQERTAESGATGRYTYPEKTAEQEERNQQGNK